MKQKRHWVATVWPGHLGLDETATEEEFALALTTEWKAAIADKRVKFACGQLERNGDGALHGHGYVEFADSLRRTQVVKWLGGSWEPRHETRTQARDYVTKPKGREAPLATVGEWRPEGRGQPAREGPKARALRYVTQEGLSPKDIALLDPECYFTFHRSIHALWDALHGADRKWP